MTDAPRNRALTAVSPARFSIALLAAGALALTGCSSAENTSSSETATSSPGIAAATTTSGASTTASSVDAAGALSDALAASRDAGSGRVEAATDTRRGEHVTTIATSGVFSDPALRMEITTRISELGESSIEVRRVDDSAYVYGLAGGGEEQWVQATPEEANVATGLAGGSDPSQLLALLEYATDDVERVGQEQVSGVEATHYSGSIDLETAVQERSMQQDDSSGVEQLRQVYAQMGLSTIGFDLYVGPDGLPVRMTTTAETTDQEQEFTAVSAADFSDWGTEVDVEAPEDAVLISEITLSAPTATPSS